MLLFKYRYFGRVERYFESHTLFCVPCIVGFGKVKGSRDNHALVRALSNCLNWRPLFLVFMPRIHRVE
jgi:hypothetical protein